MTLPNAFYAPLDPHILQSARRGELAAIGTIYERYGRACFNLALRVLGDAQSAEDVVQDVFVRMIPAIRQFRGDSPFGAWLRRMVANATVDELRRRRWLDTDDAMLDTAAPGAEALPEIQAEAWRLLMELPARARAVLVLHELEGYTHRELALLFGQSESYSKSILARALERLRQRADLMDEVLHVQTRAH